MAKEARRSIPRGVNGVVKWVRKSRLPPNHHLRGHILLFVMRGDGSLGIGLKAGVPSFPSQGPQRDPYFAKVPYLKAETRAGPQGPMLTTTTMMMMIDDDDGGDDDVGDDADNDDDSVDD